MGLDISLYNSRKNESLMYWRKANWIVSFFEHVVGNTIENCEDYKVGRCDIELLRDNCEKVLSLRDNMGMIPVEIGFEYELAWRNEYGNLRFFRRIEDGSGEIVDKHGRWCSVGGYDGLKEEAMSNYTSIEIAELLPLQQLDDAISDCHLEPCSGFFFGGQDIDDWYFDSLENTVKMCNDVLATKARVFYFSISY